MGIWTRKIASPSGIKYSAARGFCYEVWATYYKKIFSGLQKKDATMLYNLILHSEDWFANSLIPEMSSGPPQNNREIREIKRSYLKRLYTGASMDNFEVLSNRFSLTTYKKADPTRRNTIIFVSSLALRSRSWFEAGIEMGKELDRLDKGDLWTYLCFAVHNVDKRHYVLLGDAHPKHIQDKIAMEYNPDDLP